MWWWGVVVWACAGGVLGRAQQHAGVPLPSLHLHTGQHVPQQQAGAPVPGPHLHSNQHVPQQQAGVPLPGPHLHAGQQVPQQVPGPGVALQAADSGVPLPLPVPADPVVIVPQGVGAGLPLDGSRVPLETGSGVPLETGSGVPLETGSGMPLETGSGVPLPGTGAIQPAVNPPSTVGGGVAGGVRVVGDPDQDPDVKRALQTPALHRHLQQQTRADKAVKISSIVSAHKQVVSGQLVYVTVRVGETRCPVGTPDLQYCPLDASRDEYVCELLVWYRPWLNTSKLISERSRCAETEDDADFKRWGVVVPLPASSPTEVSLPALPDQLDRQQVGLEAFNYVDHGAESRFRGEMILFDTSNIRFERATNTTRVQVDVEYGFTLCLRGREVQADARVCPRDPQRPHYICSVTVVHNPNQIASLEVVPLLDDHDDIHCQRKRVVQEELVVPVQQPCAGCPQPAPLNDPTILSMADFALKEYDRTADEDNLHVMLHLVKAHSQVVAGVKYYLTLELVESHCAKTLVGVDVNRTFCSPDPTEETKLCDLQVVDQPWVPARDLVAARCYDKTSYPAHSQDEFIVPVSSGPGLVGTASPGTPKTLVGGHTPVQVDQEVLEAARAVVEEYNRRERDHEYHKLVKVHQASSQVVSGKLFSLVVELGETNCHSGDPTLGSGDHCVLDPTEEHEVCTAQVHVQPWVQPPGQKKVTTLTCDDLSDYLLKKMTPSVAHLDMSATPFLDPEQDATAGYQQLATNNSAVMQAAAFVLDQYNLHSDEDELYTLVRVATALAQTEADGLRYHLELQLAETHCKKYLPIADPSRCAADPSEEEELCQAEVVVPAAPTTTPAQLRLARLYCDEATDYYATLITRKLGHGQRFTQESGSRGGVWTAANLNDEGLKQLGHLIADEFDMRSDEDSLFLFHKVVQARKKVAEGVLYHMVVELLESVCPKYKRRIDKTRCAPDIGEDHVVCEATISSKPWLQKQEMQMLRCAEKDDFTEGHDSVEVLLPSVHPSAHARPVFKSHFTVRSSDESIESNERFYRPNSSHHSGQDTTDEDDDDDSDEVWRRLRGRGRRGLVGAPEAEGVCDPRVQQVAAFAMQDNRLQGSDASLRVLQQVLSVNKQVVAGLKWTLSLHLAWTNCPGSPLPQDLTSCSPDPSRPPTVCEVEVWERPWEDYREVLSVTCTDTNPADLPSVTSCPP